MAITNKEIILAECAFRGITEEIHTFQKWKELGFCVRKGEKSDIKFQIWKYTKPRKDKETGEEIKAHAFMANAAFFRYSQVERLHS